jgi:dolichyl-phosphate-mannose-protein mannosyltransferase
VTALVGLYTVEDLWKKLGDLSMPKMRYLAHFLARVLGLILIPIALYVGTFWLHFAILNRSGPVGVDKKRSFINIQYITILSFQGDAQMSSLFQAQLQGNKLFESPVGMSNGCSLCKLLKHQSTPF